MTRQSTHHRNPGRTLPRALGRAAVALAFSLAACGGDAEPDAGAMPDMEMQGAGAEGHEGMDHSQHMMGGAPDTRQPVTLTAEQQRALGVTFHEVGRMTLERTVRTVGQVQAPESAEATVTPKIQGFVEELLVATTGEAVVQGQPLLRVYSPELVAAQEQLLAAKRLADQVDPAAEEAYASAQSMLAAAQRRLDYWDITDDQIQHLLEMGHVQRTLTLVSPVDGIVLEKGVVEGQQVTPGMPLYRIADLSSVWVEGEVFEQDLELVGQGTMAHMEVSAYPGDHFMGRVTFVHPTLDQQTRTNRVRVSLRNPGLRLKPGMFVTMFFDVEVGQDVVAVPTEAVVMTGERNLVFVHHADGSLQPHEVVLGRSAQGAVEILSGVEPGAHIVASATFLVDAESRLGGGMAGMGSMPGMQHGPDMAPDMAQDSAAAEAVDHSGHEGHAGMDHDH